MKKLLHKDITKRINYKDIPSHPWFEEIDFNKIVSLEATPPYIPDVEDELDFSNIDPIFLNEAIASPFKQVKQSFDDNLFSEF